MADNKQKVPTLKDRYLSMVTRQRVITLLVINGLIFVLFDVLWYQPQNKEVDSLKRRLAVLQTERSDIIKTNNEYQQIVSGTAFNEKRSKLLVLNTQQEAVNKQLSEFAQLITAKEMPEVLRSVFKNSSKLKLISLKKHPVKEAFKRTKPSTSEVVNESEIPATAVASKGDVRLYRHDFTLTLSGNYFNLLESLETLEALKIKIYWEKLSYQVESYPNADISITIYTYSYEEHWLGA